MGAYGTADGLVMWWNPSTAQGELLSLDNGEMVAAIKGSGLYAAAGEIGGWTVASGKLVGGNVSGEFTGMQSGAGSTKAFFAGAVNSSGDNAAFHVTAAGALYASLATISGAITATSGSITGELYVGSASPRILIDGANKRIESTNFASGASGFRQDGVTGNAEFNNITARGAIITAVFQKSLVTAFAGSQIVSKSASRLYSDLTIGSSMTLDVDLQDGAAPFASGDIVRIKDGTYDVWATVNTGSSGGSYWRYTATRQSGSSSGTIRKGCAVVDYGQSGDGYVMLSADGSNKPWVSVVTHAGSPWSSLTERARLGNLNGISGASGYGLWSDNVFLTGTFNIQNQDDILASQITNDAGWTAGVNLVDNGNAESGTTNWTTWSRATTGAYDGEACFYTTSYQTARFNDDYIVVDPTARYEMAAALRTGLSNTVIYAGLAFYTADKALISPHHCHRYPATYDTTLYEACSAGATSVKIVPPSQDWAALSYPYIQFSIQANGADLPNFSARSITNIDKGGAPSYWTLTLGSGTAAAYGAGTAVGISQAGYTYAYCLVVGQTPGTSWMRYVAQMDGQNVWNAMPTNNQFRIGTVYVRAVVLANWNQSDTTYLDAVSLTPVQQATIDAAAMATNYFDSTGKLVGTQTPSGSGLFMNSQYMGYYDGSGWKTYLNNTGTFYLSDGVNKIALISSTPEFRLGDATGYDAGGEGFWVGKDSGTYKLRIGRKPSDGYGYLAWNGSNLIINVSNLGGTVNQSLDVGTTGHIKGGASSYSSGTGFFLGYDGGAHKFRVGDPSGQYLRWTGSAVEVKGTLYSTSGNIGGFTISDNTLYAINNDAQIGLYLKAGTTPCIYGSYTRSRINFYLDGIDIYGGANTITGDTYLSTMSAGGSAWNTPNIEVTSSGVGFFNVTPAAQPSAYTFTNGSADRSINCSSTSLQELANVVYTMWNDLKNYGLLA